MKTPSVCAVLVTHNRRALLQEALDALLQQSHRPDKILVVDNASDSGTRALLKRVRAEVGERLEWMRLPKNTGGAGGFHHGLRWAHERGYDWAWVMDDDAIPTDQALASLLKAQQLLLNRQQEPVILSSTAIWTDRQVHPMNRPRLKRCRRLPGQLKAMRSASFVATLIRLDQVERFGLPIADYFIWNDDTEYTGRVLRHQLGVWVPDSQVVHKTPQKYTPMSSSGPRFYYELRNKLWMIRFSQAWGGYDRLRYLLAVSKNTGLYILRNKLSPDTASIVLNGLRDGLIKSPRLPA